MATKHIQLLQRMILILLCLAMLFNALPVLGMLLGQQPQTPIQQSFPYIEDLIATGAGIVATSPQMIFEFFDTSNIEQVSSGVEPVPEECIDPALLTYSPTTAGNVNIRDPDGTTTLCDGNDGSQSPTLLARTTEPVPDHSPMAEFLQGVYNIGDYSDPFLATKHRNVLNNALLENDTVQSPPTHLTPQRSLSKQNVQFLPFETTATKTSQPSQYPEQSITLIDGTASNIIDSSPQASPKCPHECPKCSQLFRRLRQLKEHHKDEHNSIYKAYKCPHCPYEAEWPKDLFKHRAKHDKTKAYECHFCHKRYSRHDNKKRHEARCTSSVSVSSAATAC